MALSNEAQLLQQAPLFSLLTEEEIANVIESSERATYAAGTLIVREGEVETGGFYLVLSGKTEVRKGDQTLTTLGPGDFFGEMALLIQAQPISPEEEEELYDPSQGQYRLLKESVPRSADVVALEETSCLVLKPWAFYGLIRSHPDVALKMLAILARRLRANNLALTS